MNFIYSLLYIVTSVLGDATLLASTKEKTKDYNILILLAGSLIKFTSGLLLALSIFRY